MAAGTREGVSGGLETLEQPGTEQPGELDLISVSRPVQAVPGRGITAEGKHVWARHRAAGHRTVEGVLKAREEPRQHVVEVVADLGHPRRRERDRHLPATDVQRVVGVVALHERTGPPHGHRIKHVEEVLR